MSKRIFMCIKGVVQGVGFRPFIYNLATSLQLKGWVTNTSTGLELEVEGEIKKLSTFIEEIKTSCPPLAIIEDIKINWLDTAAYNQFVIKNSIQAGHKFTLISPDVSTCPSCLKEILDPNDQRYRYPFTNCTNCGPRFTIIKDVPYDRPATTMSDFIMCKHCHEEYNNPTDRRFHAQPNACPKCGPQVQLIPNDGSTVNTSNPVAKTAQLLEKGKIIAIKGIGGYHLACNALDNDAVLRLRKLKHRPHKPLAVMMASMQVVKKHCLLNNCDEQLLTSTKRPIVLLKLKPNSPVAKMVAPPNRYIGVMLPYTPLHHLLFEDNLDVLVMTSGNICGEAIEFQDKEAFVNLSNIADYLLTYNRKIYIRIDDSVTRSFRGHEMIIRRSRGYVPLPLQLPTKTISILAVGSDLKNTTCLTKDKMAFLSQHNGNLESLSCINAFQQSISHLEKIFNVVPEVITYDPHPGYHSTEFVSQIKNVIKIPVQHHHAHIASCMVENGLVEDVIGVAFDGTGYGTDGIIWGGEFFTGKYQEFTRWAHLQQVPLPGGNAAVKEPWRMTISYLLSLLGKDAVELPLPILKLVHRTNINLIKKMILNNINCIPTTSAGRLFDGVAALLGVRPTITYEAQAAIEMEQMAWDNPTGTCYRFNIDTIKFPWVINLKPMFKDIVFELLNNQSSPYIANCFHQTIAEIIKVTCQKIRKQCGLNKVVLSGGVMQNMLLLTQTVSILKKANFQVYTHSKVPANDGGISLGQAAVAAELINNKGG